MREKFRKPQEGGTPQKIIPPLGFLFGICSLLFFALDPSAPWIGAYCLWLGKFSMFLALCCLVYWLLIHRDVFLNLKKEKNSLAIVYTNKMSEFLYQAGAYTEDPYNSDYVDVPQVKEIKNGIKIKAGVLRSRLTSDKFVKSLESFLNQNGYDIFVSNARYHSDGWVYYSVMQGIDSDRMRF